MREYFGLNELDRHIERFVDFDNGVFFEAGANDGVRQSNSLYFEMYRGWRGVLVEPIPHRFAQCRLSRPNSKVYWSALVPEDWADPFVELTYCDLMTVTSDKNNDLDRVSHVKRGEQFLEEFDSPRSIHAPARTITSLLIEAGVKSVDMLSLDVEGFESEALKGLDSSLIDVKILCVETKLPEKVLSILGVGYDLIEQISFHDYIYKKKEA